MDLTRAIGYRGFALNSISHQAGTSDMSGCEISSVEYSAVPGVGYDEKRALHDGYDSSDVFLGKRNLNLSGNLYGLTRPATFASFLDLSDVMTPTDAYEGDTSNRGFHAFDFYLPTPTELLHLLMFARPVATPGFAFSSDRSGGEDIEPLAIPWQARLECRDPRMYAFTAGEHLMTGNVGAFTAENDGNRPTSFRLTLIVATGATFTLTLNGVLRLTLTLGIGTTSYDTAVKVLTLGTALRMDLLSVTTGSHPALVTGNSSVDWTCSQSLQAGSKMEYRSAWA